MNLSEAYKTLGQFGRELLQLEELDEGLPRIAAYTKATVGADRCSVFIYDDKDRELWTTVADGVDKIIIPSDQGIIGLTVAEREAIIENDPYSNPHFNKSVDEMTGYTTRNMLTAPIFDSAGRVLGAIQLLNKTGGDFDKSDSDFMRFFTHFISSFLELVMVRAKNSKYTG